MRGEILMVGMIREEGWERKVGGEEVRGLKVDGGWGGFVGKVVV